MCRGLEAIPLSVDLWLGYLELYHKMYNSHDGFQVQKGRNSGRKGGGEIKYSFVTKNIIYVEIVLHKTFFNAKQYTYFTKQHNYFYSSVLRSIIFYFFLYTFFIIRACSGPSVRRQSQPVDLTTGPYYLITNKTFRLYAVQLHEHEMIKT